jgi:hypothetical protein
MSVDNNAELHNKILLRINLMLIVPTEIVNNNNNNEWRKKC